LKFTSTSMSVTMHHLVLVLACIAQGLGRRLQTASKTTTAFENVWNLLRESDTDAHSDLIAGAGLDNQNANPLEALATALSADSSLAGFKLSNPTARSHLGRTASQPLPPIAAAPKLQRHVAPPCLVAAVAEKPPVVVGTKIVTCENCHASYELDAELLKDGQEVRCAVCGHEWFQTQSGLQDMPANMEFVEYPQEMKARLDAGQPVKDYCCFVGGLHPDTTEEELKTHFEQCGAVESVKVIKDFEGYPRGFAFVVMRSWADGQRAMKELDKTKVQGSLIHVKESTTKSRPTRPVDETDKWIRDAGKPISAFKEGEKVQGTVTNVAKAGVFINIGCLKDALLPPMRMQGAKPVKGDIITNLEVERVDRTRKQLTLRFAQPSAVQHAPMADGVPIEEFTKGQKVEGIVTHTADFGVFFSIGAQRDALLPIGEWTAEELPKVGDQLKDLEIAMVDEEKKRLFLKCAPKKRLKYRISKNYNIAGSKQSQEESRQREGEFIPELQIGQPVEGIVKHVAAGGFFIDIGAEKYALLPLDKVTGEAPQAGDLIQDLAVESIDERTSRITLSRLADGLTEKQRHMFGFGTEEPASLEASTAEDLQSTQTAEAGEDGTEANLQQATESVSSNEDELDAEKEEEEVSSEPSASGAGKNEALPQETQEPVSTPELDQDHLKISELHKGQKVQGTVTRVEHRGLYIDIGAQEDGLLPNAACTFNSGMPNVGDWVMGLEIDRVDVSKGKFRLRLSTLDGDDTEARLPSWVVPIPAETDEAAAEKEKSSLKTSDRDASNEEALPQQESEPETPPKILAVAELHTGQKVEGTVTRVENRGVYIDVGAQAEGLLPSAACTMSTGMPSVGDLITGLEIDRIDTAKERFRLKLSKSTAVEVPISKLAEENLKEPLTTPMRLDTSIEIGPEHMDTSKRLPRKQLPARSTEAVSETEKVEAREERVAPEPSRISASALNRDEEDLLSPVAISKLRKGQKAQGMVTDVRNSGLLINIGAQKSGLLPSSACIFSTGLPSIGDWITDLEIDQVDLEKEHFWLTFSNLNARMGATLLESQEFWIHPEGKAISEFVEGQQVEGSVTGITRIGMFVDIGAQNDAVLPTSACEEMPKLGTLVTDLEIDRIDSVKQKMWLKCSTVDEHKGLTLPRAPEEENVEAVPQQETESKEENVEAVPQEVQLESKVESVAPTPQEAGETNDQPQPLKVSDFHVGQKLDGTITYVAEFGFFVNIGAAKAALLPVPASRLSEGKDKPGDVIRDLEIAALDLEKEQVLLELRQKDVYPRAVTLAGLKKGEKVDGTVTGFSSKGVFVNVGPLKDGILPSWQFEKKNMVLKKGDVIKGLEVHDVDLGKDELLLSFEEFKEDTNDPLTVRWIRPQGKSISELHRGQVLQGNVTNIAEIGVFVDIGAERDGLLPKEVIGNRRLEVGDFLTSLEIIDFDEQRKQIWLKPAQLTVSPRLTTGAKKWLHGEGVPVSELQKGLLCKGTVTHRAITGIFVDIGSVKDGFMPLGSFKKGKVPESGDVLTDLVIDRVDAEKGRFWLRFADTYTGDLAKEPSRNVESNSQTLSNQRVEGTVTAVDKRGALLKLGMDKRGILPMDICRTLDTMPNVGDFLSDLEVYRYDPATDQHWLRVKSGFSFHDLYDGQKVQGIVRCVNNFGAFIDIGAFKDGLLPATELSQGRPQVGDFIKTLEIENVDILRERFRLKYSTAA